MLLYCDKGKGWSTHLFPVPLSAPSNTQSVHSFVSGAADYHIPDVFPVLFVWKHFCISFNIYITTSFIFMNTNSFHNKEEKLDNNWIGNPCCLIKSQINYILGGSISLHYFVIRFPMCLTLLCLPDAATPNNRKTHDLNKRKIGKSNNTINIFKISMKRPAIICCPIIVTRSLLAPVTLQVMNIYQQVLPKWIFPNINIISLSIRPAPGQEGLPGRCQGVSQDWAALLQSLSFLFSLDR